MIDLKPKILLFELTTRCNLRCVHCYRTLNPPVENIDFDLNLLKNVPVEDVDTHIICGTVGDGIFYPKLKEFITESYRRNPKLTISLCTNGTAHGRAWWVDLAKMFKNRSHMVRFGIDGFEDTHKLYRVGASYKRAMENMKSFIDGGGRAIWQFILFKHNEHEIKKATRMAQELGCEFVIRKSCLFDDDSKPVKIPIFTNTEYGMMFDGKINCRMDRGELSILANGDVMPCCHIIDEHQEIYHFAAKSIQDYHLNDIIKDGYLQKFWSGRYDRGICKKCKASAEDFTSIEQLVLDYIKTRRMIKDKEREQKKDQSNKR